MKKFDDFNANHVREIILRISKSAHVGHIGSALSVADILTEIYKEYIYLGKTVRDANRDRFILSKGHASAALYAVLYLKGVITRERLETFCCDNSLLGVHPDHQLPGIDFSTGSLGQGLCMGVGSALAAKLKDLQYKTFVLLSDAECNEGSIWEAAMFAAHHKLDNLIVVIDVNKQQALGKTCDILDIEPLHEKWSAFGWNVYHVDGHNGEEIGTMLNTVGQSRNGKPHVCLANTVFGKGVSFMEGCLEWHYYPMSEIQYHQALSEVREYAK